MGGGFDFREMEKLKKQLEAIERGKGDFIRECANELAQRLLAKVKRRTPVGKKPEMTGPKTIKVRGKNGKVRSFLSPQAAIWSGYMGGELRRNWTIGDIRQNGDNYEVEIINQTPYASYVEYGHRQQPGRYVPAIGKKLKRAWVPGTFMLTISAQQLEGQAPAILSRKLENYLRRCLDAE